MQLSLLKIIQLMETFVERFFFLLLTDQRSPAFSDLFATVIKHGVFGSSDPNDNLKRKNNCLWILTVQSETVLNAGKINVTYY